MRLDDTDMIVVATSMTYRTQTAPTVPVLLRYDVADPYAVTVTYGDSAEDAVDWLLSRDMLADGLLTAVGDGDVRLRPDPFASGTMLVELESDTGTALLAVASDVVADFLRRTYELVLPGDEPAMMDIDGLIDRLRQPGRA